MSTNNVAQNVFDNLKSLAASGQISLYLRKFDTYNTENKKIEGQYSTTNREGKSFLKVVVQNKDKKDKEYKNEEDFGTGHEYEKIDNLNGYKLNLEEEQFVLRRGIQTSYKTGGDTTNNGLSYYNIEKLNGKSGNELEKVLNMLSGDFILTSEVGPKRNEKDNAKSSEGMPDGLAIFMAVTAITVIIPLIALLVYTFLKKPPKLKESDTNMSLTQNNGSGNNKELSR